MGPSISNKSGLGMISITFYSNIPIQVETQTLPHGVKTLEPLFGDYQIMSTCSLVHLIPPTTAILSIEKQQLKTHLIRMRKRHGKVEYITSTKERTVSLEDWAK